MIERDAEIVWPPRSSVIPSAPMNSAAWTPVP
jgi:hypothetical protein